jgi:hypothetical protein
LQHGAVDGSAEPCTAVARAGLDRDLCRLAGAPSGIDDLGGLIGAEWGACPGQLPPTSAKGRWRGRKDHWQVTITTLITAARLNDVDPQAWLADVRARIAAIPQNRLSELLPWTWQPCDTHSYQAA